jgi:hypothetical protein
MGLDKRVVSTSLSTSQYWLGWISQVLLWFFILISPAFVVLLVGLSISFDVPGVVYHQGKVLVIVNTD